MRLLINDASSERYYEYPTKEKDKKVCFSEGFSNDDDVDNGSNQLFLKLSNPFSAKGTK